MQAASSAYHDSTLGQNSDSGRLHLYAYILLPLYLGDWMLSLSPAADNLLAVNVDDLYRLALYARMMRHTEEQRGRVSFLYTHQLARLHYDELVTMDVLIGGRSSKFEYRY